MLSHLQPVSHTDVSTPTATARDLKTVPIGGSSASSSAFDAVLEVVRGGATPATSREGTSPLSRTQGAAEPTDELLAAVRSRAVAVGLHPSDRTVYMTAVRDLERGGATLGAPAPSRTATNDSAATAPTTNPNMPGGAGYVEGGSDPTVAPMTSIDLSAPSPDTQTYTQQLFALEADPAALAAARSSSAWPSEATNDAWRRQTLIQFVAAEVGTGPYYNPTTSLTNAQVVAAQAWSQESPALNLNPTYAAALFRASEVAKDAGAGPSPLPWSGQDTTVEVLADGSFGTTPVSGFYGTGLGSAPTT